MTHIDLVHPEHLIDRARRGEASDDELTRLKAHLKDCTACSFELAAARGLDRDAEALFADNRAVQKLHVGTLKRLPLLTDQVAFRQGARRRRAILSLAAAAVVVVGVAAAAILRSGVFHSSRAMQPAASVQESSEQAPVQSSIAMSASSGSQVPQVNTAAPPSVLTTPSPRGPSAAPQLAVGELFALANATRRSGDITRAAQLYRELQRTFPRSSESALSRVTLGRLLLDRLGDPSGALAQFNAYLVGSGGGSLHEEGLIGRALALARLGRTAEERTAWRALLVYNPQTTYAEHARKRIEAIAGSSGAAH